MVTSADMRIAIKQSAERAARRDAQKWPHCGRGPSESDMLNLDEGERSIFCSIYEAALASEIERVKEWQRIDRACRESAPSEELTRKEKVICAIIAILGGIYVFRLIAEIGGCILSMH